ncbi:MAG: hypothetical protein E6767_18925 [Dysgonomonas sp.]|nr:hypothetical protein [Dysgonomonas sp.]
MSELDKFIENLDRKSENAKQAQIRFVECIAVDWDNRTMDAKGTGDGIDYIDVTLGFGYTDIKPVVGTICLIGIIDGQEVVTFLINAEEVELVEIKAGKIVYNDGTHMGIPLSPEVTTRLNLLEKAYNSLLNDFLAHNHAHPQGATTALLNPPISKAVTETIIDDIQNKNITQ